MVIDVGGSQQGVQGIDPPLLRLGDNPLTFSHALHGDFMLNVVNVCMLKFLCCNIRKKYQNLLRTWLRRRWTALTLVLLSVQMYCTYCTRYVFWYHCCYNKCIGDETKAAARQSLNCIKNKNKIKYREKTIFNMPGGILAPCNVARSRQVISSGDCTLQYGKWLWNRDSEFTKWQHPAM